MCKSFELKCGKKIEIENLNSEAKEWEILIFKLKLVSVVFWKEWQKIKIVSWMIFMWIWNPEHSYFKVYN